VNADWFYAKDDQRLGPVSEQELKGLATDGKLKPGDLVWRDGMPDWVEARTQAVLFPPKVEPLPANGADPRPFDNIDDDRPSVRDRRRRYEDDDRPSRRDGRRDDDDYDQRPRQRDGDDYDRRPRRRDDDDDYDRPRRSKQAPGQIQAVAIMMLVGGIWAILVFLGFAASCIGLVWPGIWYELVVGILAIIRGANTLGKNDQGPPRTLAILLIVCFVNLDVVAGVLGIVCLVMLNDEQVKAYYRKKGFY
jgi:hypothetical protein